MSTPSLARLPLSEGSIANHAVGDYVAFERTLDAALVDAYADLILDHSPLHVDETYAKTTTFERRVVHGMLLTSHFSSIVGMLMPGRNALLTSIENDYAKPVYVGDTVTFSARVVQVDTARSRLRLSCIVLRGHEVCARGMALVEVRR